MKKRIIREFLRYVLLNVSSMLALSLYILADTFFISRGCGALGLAALNLALPIYNIITGCALMIGIGGAIRYNICKSRGERKNQDSVFTHACLIAAFFAVIFVLSGLFSAGSIARLLGADQDTFDMTVTYIRIMLIFAPLFLSADILNAFVRNDGEPRLAAIAATSGCLANIIFDYILIIKAGLGIFGAVLATGFSPVFGLIIMSPYFIKKKNGFHLKLQKPSVRSYRQFLPLGLSSLVNELSSGIVIIIYNLLILNLQGNTGVASYGIIANISLVVSYIFTGVAQGMQPLASRFYGEGNTKNTGMILRYTLLTMILIAGAVLLITECFSQSITLIFNTEHDPALQMIASHGLRLYFLAAPLMGLNIVMSYYFASVEKALPSQVISISRGFAVLIPSAFILSGLFGMNGVWISLAVTELIVALMGIIFFIKTKR